MRKALPFTIVYFLLLSLSLLSHYSPLTRSSINKITGKLTSKSSSSAKIPETKILLMTYKRSGSTFLGELFQQNSQTWYFFEPLAFFASPFQKNRFTWESAEQPYSELREAYRERIQYLDDILSCRFKDQTLLQYYADGLNNINNRSRFFHPSLVVKRSKGLLAALQRPEGRPLREWCLQYPLRVAKTIRLLHLQAVYDYLPNDIRIVHLVRDPRAIHVSRNSRAFNPASICKPLAENLRLISERGDERVILVKYEDLARQPRQMALRLYATLGLIMPHSVETWIQEFTNAAENRNKSIHPTKNGGASMRLKRNSTEAATHWLWDIDPLEARGLDGNSDCRYIYRLMGYSLYDHLVRNSQPLTP